MFVAIHILGLLVVAWFILFAASKAEGLVRRLGNLLAALLVLVAVVGVVAVGAHALGYRTNLFGRMHAHQDASQDAPASANP